MPLRPCRLSHVLVDEGNDRQAVVIAECEGPRRLHITIGPTEALAIDRAVKGQRFPRPLTHDLITAILQATGHQLAEVRIVDLREGTFFAEIVLARPDGGRAEIDCRPSDALALLVRHGPVPLLIAEEVLAEAAETA